MKRTASPQRKELGTRLEVNDPAQSAPDLHNTIGLAHDRRNCAQLLSAFPVSPHQPVPNSGAHLHYVMLPRSGGAVAGWTPSLAPGLLNRYS